MKKLLLLFILLPLLCYAQEEQSLSNAIIYEPFPTIDDTAAIITVEAFNTGTKMYFPYHYDVLQGELDTDYQKNKVVVIVFGDIENTVIQQERDRYLNQLLIQYQNAPLQIVGRTDFLQQLPIITAAHYPITKDLDEQLYYLWEGVIIVDKQGIIQAVFDCSNMEGLNQLIKEIQPILDDLIKA